MGRTKMQKRRIECMPSCTDTEDDEGFIERSKYVYELVNGWIANADNKVSISCGIFTGVFGVVKFLTERYIQIPDNPVINECWSYLYKGSFILSLVLMAAAVICYATAVIPNLKSAGKKNDEKKDVKNIQKQYPVFYGDIKALKTEKYQELMANGTNKAFADELVLESWHNSKVCLRKMKWYKAGVLLSIAAITFAFISLIAHFLMYK